LAIVAPGDPANPNGVKYKSSVAIIMSSLELSGLLQKSIRLPIYFLA